jgi:hypothetical protein
MQFRQIGPAIPQIGSVMFPLSQAASRGLSCFRWHLDKTEISQHGRGLASRCEELQRPVPYRLRYWATSVLLHHGRCLARCDWQHWVEPRGWLAVVGKSAFGALLPIMAES